MTITVNIKNIYGTELVYPVCSTALTLARLTGRKTFTAADIKNIKQLGYTFKVAEKEL